MLRIPERHFAAQLQVGKRVGEAAVEHMSEVARSTLLRDWCEAFSSGVGRQGARREESGGPTLKGGKVEVFDIL